jgi:hypothetical protein
MANDIDKRQAGIAEVYDTRKVFNKLTDLMEKVTGTECTADTVNAACNCVARMNDLLRIHLEADRLKRKYRSSREE